ncbi:MAG: hypothetical protein H5T86_16125, partial [Armatimonadetes bacterium]|nr:hypothetical protein [Armatimonadota bacterium]
FVQHVNRYTGLAYKDDPAVVALELINEPLYPPGTSDAQVVSYINALVDAVRAAGCRKPIFFNCWGERQKAVAQSAADGASCGWYPTGLVAGRCLWDNFLPRVSHYTMFGRGALDGKPKIIYEFDAADVPGSYMYPAMARSFREAGVQIATQFQYDCLPLAPYNRCWQTHYLNLVYAPAKAISFAIAAEVFERVPRGTSFGEYPSNSRFGPFTVSYDEDVSLLCAEDAFMNSGPTSTKPPAPEKLERVWGCGSSPIVEYKGTGAYFLDRVRPGCWKLELYPDAVWVNDPYGRPGPDREVSRLIWRQHEMAVRLPDLGAEFYVRRPGLAEKAAMRARSGRFVIRPGVWLLVRDGVSAPSVPAEFVCPPQRPGAEPAAWALMPRAWVAGADCPIEVRAAGSEGAPESVEVWLVGREDVRRVRLAEERPYLFTGILPGDALRGEAVDWVVA